LSAAGADFNLHQSWSPRDRRSRYLKSPSSPLLHEQSPVRPAARSGVVPRAQATPAIASSPRARVLARASPSTARACVSERARPQTRRTMRRRRLSARCDQQPSVLRHTAVSPSLMRVRLLVGASLRGCLFRDTVLQIGVRSRSEREHQERRTGAIAAAVRRPAMASRVFVASASSAFVRSGNPLWHQPGQTRGLHHRQARR
jgi:hypothetical protein